MEQLDVIQVVRIFRILRAFRVFKLVRSLTFFRNFFKAAWNTFKIIYLILFLLIVMIIIFALLGMEIFAFKIAFDDNGRNILNYKPKYDTDGNRIVDPKVNFPESNFNNLGEALTTVFIVIANENWSTVYIEHVKMNAWYSIYFLALLIVGQLYMFNLFTASLVINFGDIWSV